MDACVFAHQSVATYRVSNLDFSSGRQAHGVEAEPPISNHCLCCLSLPWHWIDCTISDHLSSSTECLLSTNPQMPSNYQGKFRHLQPGWANTLVTLIMGPEAEQFTTVVKSSEVTDLCRHIWLIRRPWSYSRSYCQFCMFSLLKHFHFQSCWFMKPWTYHTLQYPTHYHSEFSSRQQSETIYTKSLLILGVIIVSILGFHCLSLTLPTLIFLSFPNTANQEPWSGSPRMLSWCLLEALSISAPQLPPPALYDPEADAI